MKADQIFSLLEEFHAVYGRWYKYVAGTWWAWDPDSGHWVHEDCRARMGRALGAMAVDMFPDDKRVARQVSQEYMITRLLRELRPGFTADVLTCPGSQ